MPHEEIGSHLPPASQMSSKLLESIDSELAPESRPAMQELAQASRAIRLLANYLERHPEALLRGKPEK